MLREAPSSLHPEFADRLRTGQGGKDDEKREYSIYKYFSRACTRCTPSAFSPVCSTGTSERTTDIELERSIKYTRTTRLDMQYLCALIQQIEKIPEDQGKAFILSERQHL